MNILIKKKEFYEAVHIAARFAQRKSATLAALSSILIIASNEGIKLRATNLETGVDLTLSGKVSMEGVVAVPATILQQVASSLTGDGDVTLEHTGDILQITSSMGKSIIKTAPHDDFPSIPSPEQPTSRVVLPGTALKGLFSTLSSCTSGSTVRPELASISIVIEGGILTAAATDSFRLAEKKLPVTNAGVQGRLLIPAKNALDIAQVLPDDEVTVTFDEHQCAFTHEGGVYVSRLTNAVYPDYRQIIPKEVTTEATVLRKDFESALKHTMIFSDTFQKIRLSFDTKKNACTLFAKNTDVGEASETIPANISGADLDLSFNHRYLATVFSLTNAESITLIAAGPGRPLVIKGVGDNSVLYLVSPMNQ